MSAAEFIQAASCPPMIAYGWDIVAHRVIGLPVPWPPHKGWSICAGMGIVVSVPHDFTWLAGSTVSLLASLLFWWWRSDRRKRAFRLLGGKARAVRARMARKMRSLRPRPVLRPVPQAI